MRPRKRSVWLRRSVPSAPNRPGMWQDLKLSVIGNAAARETFVTATSHMAAIWTDLFRSMIAQGPELRWRGNGPGIGRDARIAFSGLFGRYMARAYLTEYEGVRVLVPLDVAKRQLEGTDYVIKKDPPSRGHEADWIGIDNQGLVIVEAKGTFNDGIKPWHDRYSQPPILQTAIEQVERTAVFDSRRGRKLRAKRWAIASRWGTEDNGREPTLLAWDSNEEELRKEDYRTLANILHGADVGSILKGLGHSEADEGVSDKPLSELSEPTGTPLRVRVGSRPLGLGFAALVGPFGVYPLSGENASFRIPMTSGLNLSLAVVLLSSRYIKDLREQIATPGESDLRFAQYENAGNHPANRAGLTVVWPGAGEEIDLQTES